MTQPLNYSEWQSGKIAPALEGVYERRFKYRNLDQWSGTFKSRFKEGRWGHLAEKGESIWQVETTAVCQWRGLIEGMPGE